MKTLFTFLVVCSFFAVRGQILPIGGSLGTNQNFSPWVFGGMIEIKPKTAMLSLNFDPSISFYAGLASFNYPVYFKLSIGENFRVCPNFGFIGRKSLNSPDKSYGGTLGLLFEKRVLEKNFVFLKFDFMQEEQKFDARSPGGSNYQGTYHTNNFWFAVGYRTILL